MSYTTTKKKKNSYLSKILLTSGLFIVSGSILYLYNRNNEEQEIEEITSTNISSRSKNITIYSKNSTNKSKSIKKPTTTTTTKTQSTKSVKPNKHSNPPIKPNDIIPSEKLNQIINNHLMQSSYITINNRKYTISLHVKQVAYTASNLQCQDVIPRIEQLFKKELTSDEKKNINSDIYAKEIKKENINLSEAHKEMLQSINSIYNVHVKKVSLKLSILNGISRNYSTRNDNELDLKQLIAYVKKNRLSKKCTQDIMIYISHSLFLHAKELLSKSTINIQSIRTYHNKLLKILCNKKIYILSNKVKFKNTIFMKMLSYADKTLMNLITLIIYVYEHKNKQIEFTDLLKDGTKNLMTQLINNIALPYPDITYIMNEQIIYNLVLLDSYQLPGARSIQHQGFLEPNQILQRLKNQLIGLYLRYIILTSPNIQTVGGNKLLFNMDLGSAYKLKLLPNKKKKSQKTINLHSIKLSDISLKTSQDIYWKNIFKIINLNCKEANEYWGQTCSITLTSQGKSNYEVISKKIMTRIYYEHLLNKYKDIEINNIRSNNNSFMPLLYIIHMQYPIIDNNNCKLYRHNYHSEIEQIDLTQPCLKDLVSKLITNIDKHYDVIDCQYNKGLNPYQNIDDKYIITKINVLNYKHIFSYLLLRNALLSYIQLGLLIHNHYKYYCYQKKQNQTGFSLFNMFKQRYADTKTREYINTFFINFLQNHSSLNETQKTMSLQAHRNLQKYNSHLFQTVYQSIKIYIIDNKANKRLQYTDDIIEKDQKIIKKQNSSFSKYYIYKNLQLNMVWFFKSAFFIIYFNKILDLIKTNINGADKDKYTQYSKELNNFILLSCAIFHSGDLNNRKQVEGIKADASYISAFSSLLCADSPKILKLYINYLKNDITLTNSQKIVILFKHTDQEELISSDNTPDQEMEDIKKNQTFLNDMFNCSTGNVISSFILTQ